MDLVFTGGYSLFESKRFRHPHVYCFPSSVDHAHFSQRGEGDYPDQQNLPSPRLGYYGVIDERLDLVLLAHLADARPQWQIVMVGPTVKVEANPLPRRANLQWLGQKPYADLPAFLAGWDLCLMPFALNESTRFISPTKTLEFLAAGKPVVSTAVRDVARQHANVVEIASSRDDFVASCDRILHWDLSARNDFLRRAAATVAGTSWDRAVAAMEVLLRTALSRTPSQTGLSGTTANQTPAPR